MTAKSVRDETQSLHVRSRPLVFSAIRWQRLVAQTLLSAAADAAPRLGPKVWSAGALGLHAVFRGRGRGTRTARGQRAGSGHTYRDLHTPPG